LAKCARDVTKKIDPESGAKTQFKPGQSGNPTGPQPGYKHMSTWIQQLLNDPKFEAKIKLGEKIVEYKGAPMKAIIQAQMVKALEGDVKAFDVLGKYGFGTKLELANNPDNPITQTLPNDIISDFISKVKNDTKQK